jgi:hypothetical protein
MLRFHRRYFISALFLFIVEVMIALYLHDAIIRPYVGDLLVVILIYCFIKAFFDLPVLPLALYVLLFAYAIEFLQWLQLIKLLGLQHSKLANIILGNLFEWIDMIAYTVGILIVILLECFHTTGSKTSALNNPAKN